MVDLGIKRITQIDGEAEETDAAGDKQKRSAYHLTVGKFRLGRRWKFLRPHFSSFLGTLYYLTALYSFFLGCL